MFSHIKSQGSITRVLFVYLVILFMSCVITKAYAGGYTQHQVSIKGFAFVPQELHVMAGDTVIWVNHDIVPHSIVISGTEEAISPEFDKGENFMYVVKSKMDYECGLHPSMKGIIIIPRVGVAKAKGR